jgi:hypothetical protein
MAAVALWRYLKQFRLTPLGGYPYRFSSADKLGHSIPQALMTRFVHKEWGDENSLHRVLLRLLVRFASFLVVPPTLGTRSRSSCPFLVRSPHLLSFCPPSDAWYRRSNFFPQAFTYDTMGGGPGGAGGGVNSQSIVWAAIMSAFAGTGFLLLHLPLHLTRRQPSVVSCSDTTQELSGVSSQWRTG